MMISEAVKIAFTLNLQHDIESGHKPVIARDTDASVVVDCERCGALLFGVDPAEEPYIFRSHQRKCTAES